jgi:hypothetical protein
MSSGLFFSRTDVLLATATNAAIRYGRNSQKRKVPRFGKILLTQLEAFAVFHERELLVCDGEARSSFGESF